MSEFSPPSGETSPQPKAATYTDILATPQWYELRQKAEQSEDEAVLFGDEDMLSDSFKKRIVELISDLNDAVDWQYVGQPCQVVCSAYHVNYLANETDCTDDERRAASTPAMLDSGSVVFHGAGMFYADGRWQAMVELYLTEHTDQQPSEFYYAPLRSDAFINLRVQEPTDDDESYEFDQSEADAQQTALSQALSDHSERCQDFLHSESFVYMSAAQQREWLAQSVDDIDRELPHELRGVDVAISCKQYSAMYDDMPSMLFPEVCNDAADAERHSPLAITGTIQNFEYTELLTIAPEIHLNSADFNLNGGMSFMIVRNEQLKVTYYVPLQSIVTIS